MFPTINEKIPELLAMKHYPKKLYYKGNMALLKRLKISIVGTRRPSLYTQNYTHLLAKALAKGGVCIVSGGAMGVDAIAHKGAGASSTIAVVANGLDIYYPKVNQSLLHSIEEEGLVLSQFEAGKSAQRWSFVVRNELVVALGDVLVVTEADKDSGTMHSVEYALKMGKEVWVLPQRLGESEGTQALLSNHQAKAIYDIDAFVAQFALHQTQEEEREDEFAYFCQKNPTFEEALARFGATLYEAELEGRIAIENGRIRWEG